MRTRITVLLILFLLSAVSCSQDKGFSEVTLNLVTGEKDLSVSMDSAPEVFEYRISSNQTQGDWVRLGEGQSSTVLGGIRAGQWVFEGRAYSSSNVLMYEGSAAVMIGQGNNNNVSLYLRRTNVSSAGTGNLSFTITTPVSRNRTSETLQIKYRLVGTENYSFRVLPSPEIPQEGNLKTWTAGLNTIPAGFYEVVVTLLNNQTEVLGRAFVADVRPGRTCTVTGKLDGGTGPESYTIELTLADLITLAENENCTKVITGLTDGFTGQDIDAAVINKGGTYQLRFCSRSSIGETDSLSTFGILTELYDFTNDSDRSVLSSKEFIMITNDCTVLPSENWFQPGYKPADQLPKVRTMYVNKNLTGNFSISGVINLTRLILGNDMTAITGKAAISNTNSLPELSIPAGITELGDKAIRLADGPANMQIYCSLSSEDVAKIFRSSGQTVHTTGPRPISEQ